jgi:hypothetical protein
MLPAEEFFDNIATVVDTSGVKVATDQDIKNYMMSSAMSTKHDQGTTSQFQA